MSNPDKPLTDSERQALEALRESFPAMPEHHLRGALLKSRTGPEPVPAPARAAAPAQPAGRPVAAARPVVSREHLPELEVGAPAVPPALVANFFRRLEVMLTAGTPIHRALGFLTDEPDARLRLAVSDVARRVSEGVMFSRALQSHPRVFPPLAVSLVVAGERTGRLHLTLGELASWLERSERLNKRFWSAMAYPLVMLLVGVAVVAMLAIIVFPSEREVLTSLGTEMPWLTKLVMGTFELIFNPRVVLAALVLAALAALTWKPFGRSVYRRYLSDPVQRLLLALPILGPILCKQAEILMLNAMANHLESGLGFNQMQSVANLTGYRVYERRFAVYQRELATGLSVSQAMERAELFSPLSLQMFQVGEEHGRICELLRKTANLMEEDLDHSLSTLSSLLEPLLMMGMGIVVGIIVVATSLPTMQLLQQL